MLSEKFADEIARQAMAAFPGECCGLVEGLNENGILRVMRLHPARNLATAPDRFEIDPSDHIAAVKAARADGAQIIGCYHSHPGGRAEPSSEDLAQAAEEDFLWLIAATDGARCETRSFLYRASAFNALSAPTGSHRP
jgi:proteasome lid subunit RPN8/RPN11